MHIVLKEYICSIMSIRVSIHFTPETLPKMSSSTFFNSRELFDNYASLEGYDPLYLLAYENDALVGHWLFVIMQQAKHIPTVFVSRCVSYGYPDISSTTDQINVLHAMLSTLTELLHHKVLYVEIRQVSYHEAFTPLFIQHHFHPIEWLNVVNQLPKTIEEAYKKLHNGKRRQIKNNERSGLLVRPAGSLNEVLAFVHVLQQRYAHLAKPLPPVNFFTQFFEITCKQGHGVILVAIYQNKILGGMLCPKDDSTLYEWYISSDNTTYHHITPGVSITWGAICYAIENNISRMDFMGAGVASKPYGVRNFKLCFGGDLIPVLRYQYKTSPLAYFMIHTILSPFRNWLIKQINRRQVINTD